VTFAKGNYGTMASDMNTTDRDNITDAEIEALGRDLKDIADFCSAHPGAARGPNAAEFADELRQRIGALKMRHSSQALSTIGAWQQSWKECLRLAAKTIRKNSKRKH